MLELIDTVWLKVKHGTGPQEINSTMGVGLKTTIVKVLATELAFDVPDPLMLAPSS
jgi:hypothetical protein